MSKKKSISYHTTVSETGLKVGAIKADPNGFKYKYIIEDGCKVEGCPISSLHPLSFPGLIRVILVRALCRLSGVEQRVDVGCHAGSAGRGTWGIDALKRVASSRQGPIAIRAQIGGSGIICRRRSTLTRRVLAGPAGKLVLLQSITELLVASSDRWPMRGRRPLGGIVAGCIR